LLIANRPYGRKAPLASAKPPYFQARHAVIAFARDLDLRQRAYAVPRFADAQIESEPDRVAADVAGALNA